MQFLLDGLLDRLADGLVEQHADRNLVTSYDPQVPGTFLHRRIPPVRSGMVPGLLNTRENAPSSNFHTNGDTTAGARQNLYATVFDNSNYPWAGWAADWTTLPDSGFTGTCGGWTATTSGYGSFILDDLATDADEPCGSSSIILCVQQ